MLELGSPGCTTMIRSESDVKQLVMIRREVVDAGMLAAMSNNAATIHPFGQEPYELSSPAKSSSPACSPRIDPPLPPTCAEPPRQRRFSVDSNFSLGSLNSNNSDGAVQKQPRTCMFIDAEKMKARVRENLIKPQYDVANFYHREGIWRYLATHSKFEKLTLAVIAINAIWIGVDTDHNKSAVLLNAHPTFQIAEHLFCVFFSFEWFVRFMSFRKKHFGLKDFWFVFDSSLVFMMVMETWVMTLTMIALGGTGAGGGLGNASILRMARLARLSRMARMARLLRAMPELMILIKGIVAAMRSVFFTLCLLCLLLYVFAIAFTQLTVETEELGPTYFETVPMSMYTLLVYGTFMENLGFLLDEIGKESYVCSVIFLAFVLLSALTVMNMLIGVLCEVVSAVAATEREGLQVAFVTNKMQEVLDTIDQNGDGMISNDEFVKIMENPEATAALQEVGVDVIGLVDFAEFIFEDEATDVAGGLTTKRDLTLEEFMGVVLQFRGSNTATVKDIVDLRKFVRTALKQTNHYLLQVKDRLKSESRSTPTACPKEGLGEPDAFRNSRGNPELHVGTPPPASERTLSLK